MRILHREVHRYKDDNERIMKAQEEILQILTMLHKQYNKESSTKQEASVREVTASRSKSEKDNHGNGMKSRSMNMSHHSPMQSTRRTHASLRLGSNPSVSHVRRKRRRPEEDILQGELKKIKTPTSNGEYMK